MHWDSLLASSRYGHNSATDRNRTEFHKDYDRIVFSTAFRRLGRKTQVHPFSINDHVHSRLTHSIEVSSVGRSLAIAVFNLIRHEFPQELTEYHLGTILQSACLAHDIGNPPFGHAGEAAIRDWFKNNRNSTALQSLSDEQLSDFTNFDGNAQGFRILSKLEYHFMDGGMRLTYATLGSMVKYPQLAKFGFPTSIFNSEEELYRQSCRELGIKEVSPGKWVRHPLSYLMEAADDICYAILDVEDAIELGIIGFSDVRELFALLTAHEIDIDEEYKANQENFRDFLSSIRGKAIQNLIETVSKVFVEHYKIIMQGKLALPLLELSSAPPVQGIHYAKKLARKRIYPDQRKTELEVGSYATLNTILDAFINGIYEYFTVKNNGYRAERIVRIIGQQKIDSAENLAEAYHQVLDFVSGMTDNYATYLARQIGGLSQGL